MRKYDITSLLKLCALIKQEEGAKEWLAGNGCRELYEFWEAFENVEKSFRWLLENNHRELAALVDAFHGNDNAKLFLIKSGHRELAALIDASEGNKTAVEWLMKSGNKEWLPVAREIYLWNKKNAKKGFWSFFDFGNPYS
ncbi:MAG: hypothetical protein NT126_05700 [Bacteroidetes bacterium]|nr:hypothetical protein [Bacteroidota bacterium]